MLFTLAISAVSANAGDREALDEFLALRTAIVQERKELEADTAHLLPEERKDAFREWYENDAARFERMRELGLALADRRATPAVDEQAAASILPGDLRDLLELRSQLRDERRALETEVAGLSNAEKMEALQVWRDSRGESFEEERRLAQAITDSNRAPSGPVLREVPQDFPPAMREFLLLRQELQIERRELEASLVGASAKERREALWDWRDSRADTFAALKQLAEKIRAE